MQALLEVMDSQFSGNTFRAYLVVDIHARQRVAVRGYPGLVVGAEYE